MKSKSFSLQICSVIESNVFFIFFHIFSYFFFQIISLTFFSLSSSNLLFAENREARLSIFLKEKTRIAEITQQKKQEATQEDQEPIELSAKRKKYYQDKEYWDLIGNANIRHGGDFLIADKIQFFVPEKRGIATGRVRLFNHEDEVELRGQSGEYFSEDGYARLKDRVQLWIRNDEILVFGNLLERRKQIYKVQDQVRILLDSKGNRASAKEAVYEKDNKKIILRGTPRVFYEDSIYQAHEIWVFTKTREMIFKGRVRVFQDGSELRAQKLHYFSKGIEKNGKKEGKKAIFTGFPEYFEYSDPSSPLKGGIYRNIRAEKMIYFEESKTWQIQNRVRFKEFYLVQEEEKELEQTDENSKNSESLEKKEYVVYDTLDGLGVYPNRSEANFNKDEREKKEDETVFLMYQREAGADEILYREDQYVLNGKAWFYDRQRSATAEKINVQEDRIYLSGDPKLYEFDEPEILAIQSKSIPEVKQKVQADFIEYWSDEKKLFLKDHVLFEREDFTVRADFFRYDYYKEEDKGKSREKKEKGYAEGHVEISGVDHFAQADRMMFWEDPKERLVLEGSAYYQKKKNDTETKRQKKENIHFAANRIEHWDKQAKSRLSGKARVWDSEKQITAEEIQYQEIRSEERILAKGEPILRKGKEWVRSKKIRYWKDSEREVAIIEDGLYGKDEQRVSAQNMVYKNFLVSKRELFFLEGGVRIWDSEKEVLGQEGEYWILSDRDKAFLQGRCQLNYFEKNQRAESDFMEYQKDRKGEENFVLRGNAKYFRDDELSSANTMTFYPKYKNKSDDRILLVGSVEVQNPENYITGERMEVYDGEIHTYEVWENGKYIDRKEQIEVSGDQLFYDEDRDWMEATGHARYWDEKEEIEILSEKMQSDRKKKLSIALGNVEIHQEPRILYGDFARFEEEKDQLYVTGSARILEGENLSESRSILLDTKTRQVEVQGIRRGRVITDN